MFYAVLLVIGAALVMYAAATWAKSEGTSGPNAISFIIQVCALVVMAFGVVKVFSGNKHSNPEEQQIASASSGKIQVSRGYTGKGVHFGSSTTTVINKIDTSDREARQKALADEHLQKMAALEEQRRQAQEQLAASSTQTNSQDQYLPVGNESQNQGQSQSTPDSSASILNQGQFTGDQGSQYIPTPNGN